ncbi:MAG: hypothetical protein P4L36_17760 [Holophaga sp.]|nr:hypothetical protein [Holophaga sp.]
MNNSAKALLLAAAGTGLMSGAASAQPLAVPARNGRTLSANPGEPSMGLAQGASKHSCAGKNSCKAQGGCSSGDNGCKGKNSCKGKGGCSTL